MRWLVCLWIACSGSDPDPTGTPTGTPEDSRTDTGTDSTTPTGDSGTTPTAPTIAITSPTDGATLAAVDAYWGPLATVSFEVEGCTVGVDCVVFPFVDGAHARDPLRGDEIRQAEAASFDLVLADYGPNEVQLELRDWTTWDLLSSSDVVTVDVTSPFESLLPDALACTPPDVPFDVAFTNVGNNRLHIDLEDDENGWASGYAGTFQLLEGEWQPPIGLFLSGGLEITGPGTGWGATWYEGLYRLEAGVWQPYDPGFDASIYGAYSLDMVDDENGFVSTHQGVVLHLRDGVWSEEAVTDRELRLVRASDADHAWVRYQAEDFTTRVVAWDGATWTELDDPVDSAPLDMALSGTDDGFYVSWDQGIYAIDDGVFDDTALTSPTQNQTEGLRTIALWNEQNGFAAGAGGSGWLLSSGTWTEAHCADCLGISDVALSGPDQGWASCYDQFETDAGGLVRIENGSMTQLEYPSWPDYRNSAVDLMADGTGMMISGASLIRRFEGGDWDWYAPIDGRLPSDLELLAFESPYAGWVASSEALARIELGQIQVVSPALDTVDINGIDLHGDAGVVVGGNIGVPPVGDVFELDDAGTWVKSSFSAGLALQAVDLVGEDDGWAVGGNLFTGVGSVVRLDDGVWSEVETDLPAALLDVAMVDETNGWAVGGSIDLENEVSTPFLYRLVDGSWSEVTLEADTVLTAVAVRRDGFGWAVGSNGVVVELTPEGASDCPEARFWYAFELHDVAISPETGRALVVGANGIAFWL